MLSRKNQFDVIVIGVGSMGSAACWHLADQGYKVLGLEQFGVVHERGSHSGQSRIIRKAYFEHPDYVPLLNRAYENWQRIEKSTSTKIYHKTGILYMGKGSSESISGTRGSAKRYHIPLKELDHQTAKKSYPAFNLPDDFDIVMEENAGFVTPERAISSYASDAIKKGADIRSNITVLRWRYDHGVVTVETQSGNFTCEKLIITAGSWTQKIIPSLTTSLSVTKQTLAWIKNADPEKFGLGSFPCWFVDDHERGLFYGFPMLPANEFGGPMGLKVAHHQRGDPYDPDHEDKSIPESAKENIHYFLKRYMPGIKNPDLEFRQCLYTYSEDSDFIIDHLPGSERVVTIACGFSGHGFKFASVVGEILADLAVKGETDLPIGFLGLKRFRKRH